MDSAWSRLLGAQLGRLEAYFAGLLLIQEILVPSTEASFVKATTYRNSKIPKLGKRYWGILSNLLNHTFSTGKVDGAQSSGGKP